jgi:methylphosphotriester-DNA--protein-cysteine methyltransferase
MSGAVRIARGESELGRWEIASAASDPGLAGVRGYVGVESRLAITSERHLPSGEAAIVVNLGEPYDVVGVAETLRVGRVAVMGVHTLPFLTLGDGAKRLLLARLSPTAAHRLLGLPMSELADRWIALEEVDAQLARDLGDSVTAAAGWEPQFGAAERVLGARLSEAPPSASANAWDAIRRAGGVLSIGELADASGASHRRFTERFRRDVGVGPKTAARLARFNRVLAGMGRTGALPGADAALAHGYFDQAHMLAEFRAFAGAPPSVIRKSAAAFTLRA